MSRRVLGYSRGIITICLISIMITSGFIGFLVFEGMLDEGSVEAATITVDSKGGGDYATIQQAINNANSGDTIYVWAGVYNENIYIYKSVTLIGNGSANTTIDGNRMGDGIYVESSWVNISGFHITNSSYYGIRFYQVEYGHLFNNNCSNHGIGIYLYYSNNITIENNTCLNNSLGISTRVSNYLLVSNNTLKYNIDVGISIGRGQSVTITNNTMELCGLLIDTWDSLDLESLKVDLNNTVNGKPVYFWYNINNKTVPLGAGEIILMNCSNIIIENQNCSNGSMGIGIYYSNNITIRNSTISSNYENIIIYSSESSYIFNNTLNYGDWSIFLFYSNNNTIMNNNLSNNQYGGIYAAMADHNLIINNTLLNNGWEGIILEICNFITMKNNTMVKAGLYFYGYLLSNWNTHIIDNNTINGKQIIYLKNATGGTVPASDAQVILANCSQMLIQNQEFKNLNSGVLVGFSNNITIRENTFDNNSWLGVYLQNSDHNRLSNNTFSDNDRGINLDYSRWNSIIDNHCLNNGYSGIALYGSHENEIINNTCAQNDEGIRVSYSNYCTVIDNICTSNKLRGIYLSDSEFCSIANNNCSNNYRSGFQIYDSRFNNITSNICNYNQDLGIYLGSWADYNNIIKNICNYNANDGIEIEYSYSNNVVNNTCSNNYRYGIRISGYYFNVTNNTCNSNSGDGIYVYQGYESKILNNTCKFNNWSGINVYRSSLNSIKNNTLSNNLDGLVIWQSYNNLIRTNNASFNKGAGIDCRWSYQNTYEQNIISNNNFGINLSSSEENTIFENIVSYNSQQGFFISGSSDWNFIYHNNIISNPIQAMNFGNNNVWNNSDEEGNYWSDYTGLDNGANDRIAEDGIGDTKIPHPGAGCDYYPFMYPNGWLFPGQPLLVGPGEVDNDGFYIFTWNYQSRATDFVLEEDINITFNSSTILFNDSHNFYYVMNKPNGTFYYRLRAFNQNNFGPWSETLKVTVDHIPDIPQELKVTVYPEGNTLNLSWVPNIVDTKEYELYYKNATIYYWTLLGPITHPNHTFNHTGLNDGERYYYSILAKDFRDQLSDYSVPVDDIPADSRAPNAPTGLKVETISGSEVRLTWSGKQAQDISGFDIYINDTNQSSEGTFHPCQTAEGREPSCVVSGLIEQTTYHFKVRAFDEVPNYSNLSNVASITMPDLIPPSPPTELVVSNATSNSLMITWNASPEIDIVGYRIYRSQSLAKPFDPVFSEMISETKFIDTGLNESTMYFYRVKAVDDAQLESKFSEVAYGMTTLNQYPPEINNSMSNIELSEDSYDDVSINLFHWFKDPNNDQLSFNCEGQENIEIIIHESNGTVILKLKPNWYGSEIITFYASDGDFEISENVTIIVTSVNDPPGPAEIIQPQIGKRIYEDESVAFKGTCDDPDLATGDVLTFSWSSDISGNLGAGQNLSGVMLPVGKHTVTFEVTDSYGEKASASIRINVFEKTDSDETETKKDYTEIYTWTGAFIIFIIIVFIIYLIVRKKGPYTTGKFDEEIDIVLEPEGLELPEEPVEAKKAIEQEDAQIEPPEFTSPVVAEIPPTPTQPTLPPADILEEPVEELEPTLLPEDEDSSIDSPQVHLEEEHEEKPGEDLEDVQEE